MTGQIVGTMAYLSPDRIAGRPATVADDLYAVGAVGYEAVTGHQPFPQENLAALARAIAETVPPPLRMLRPDVEPVLAETIERAMARDPQWRFPTADAMRASLSVASNGNPVRPPTRVLAEPLPPPATMAVAGPVAASRNRRILYIAAALFAIVLAAVLILLESAFAAVDPQAGDHWHVAACASDVVGDTATATPSAGADRSRSSRQEEGSRQRQRQEEDRDG